LNVLSTAVLCTIIALISQEGMYSTEWLASTLFLFGCASICNTEKNMMLCCIWETKIIKHDKITNNVLANHAFLSWVLS
jgi:hypothetical protein